jgi:hypothetical protein
VKLKGPTVRKKRGWACLQEAFKLMIEPILQPSPSAPQEKASCPRFGHLDDAGNIHQDLWCALRAIQDERDERAAALKESKGLPRQ